MGQHIKINQYNTLQENEEKNHMIIWIDAEKAFYKIQYFHDKTRNKLGTEGT